MIIAPAVNNENEFAKTLMEGRLTEHQLVLIHALLDGKWRDRNELLKIPGMEGATASTISQRIIQPFELLGYITQEDRPAEKKPRGGSNKKKRICLSGDVDKYRLYRIIVLSSNRLVNKYDEKLADLNYYKANERELPRPRPKAEVEKNKRAIADYKKRRALFLEIRNESLAKCKELEQQANEQQDEYWKQRESHIPYSKSWPRLVAIERTLADAFEEQLKLSGVIISDGERARIRNKAACLARETDPDLWKCVLDESHQYEDRQKAFPTRPAASL